jgi:serine/threonine-protein kinase
LIDEVRIGRQISHPNLCRLYDVAEADGHHFVVMEYVDGEDLASLLHRIGRLPGDKALQIARHLCAGLAAAHDKGVIHRDLKPANVMIDGHGHARIADFGLAALAHSGSAKDLSGTPAYMAPRAALAGEGASLRSDVFALGLVLYEMFAGKRGVRGPVARGAARAHTRSRRACRARAHDVDPAVERVVTALASLARPPIARRRRRRVMASLPGGDPLQAALLAGETPSPEMVAAAGKVGDLAPALAWLGFVGGIVALVWSRRSWDASLCSGWCRSRNRRSCSRSARSRSCRGSDVRCSRRQRARHARGSDVPFVCGRAGQLADALGQAARRAAGAPRVLVPPEPAQAVRE